MIAFLVVTSIINLSLGYALACYLGRTQLAAASTVDPGLTAIESTPLALAQSEPVEAAEPAEQRRTEQRTAVWTPLDDVSSSDSHQLAPAEANQVTSPQTAMASVETVATTLSKAAAAVEPEVEQEMLAGIEEFRNQLAKIKGLTDEQPRTMMSDKTLAAAAS